MAWNALLLDFPPERIRLLKMLKKQYRLFLLSNTNALHQREFEQRFIAVSGGGMETIFEKVYYSHLLGLRKPNEDIYRVVVEENRLIPGETLFIDDTVSNFSGAQAVGLKTLQVKPPATILDLGLL
jgi:putative hydrolase of the HAD superfamily